MAKNRIRGSVPRTKGYFHNYVERIFLDNFKTLFFVFILLVSDGPLMSYIKKNNPDSDPVKFGSSKIRMGPDPGPLGLQRTPDTKNI